ncbi:hypothetical protein H6H02_21605 [Coleofasciculus sp. FACHB-1120]|nr:hypothetical protein [Coleofasciculus sp. FACHB-1120]
MIRECEIPDFSLGVGYLNCWHFTAQGLLSANRMRSLSSGCRSLSS